MSETATDDICRNCGNTRSKHALANFADGLGNRVTAVKSVDVTDPTDWWVYAPPPDGEQGIE